MLSGDCRVLPDVVVGEGQERAMFLVTCDADGAIPTPWMARTCRTPVPKPDPLPAFNMRAYLEGPVRETAEVYVNGQRVGVVWHPPYSIDVTSLMKPGKNELTIIVGNSAINSLAGHSLPDYRLLNDRYGERFVPQGMENLQPLPSGIVGELRLQVSPRH